MYKRFISYSLFVFFIYVSITYSQERKVYDDVNGVVIFHSQGNVIFNTSMANDGQAFYFTNANSGADIWQKKLEFSEKLEINGFEVTGDVHITPDGNRLYFVNYGVEKSTIHFMEKESNGWSSPSPANHLNSGMGDGYLSSTNSGKIYFSSQRSGGIDIYTYDGLEVQPLPSVINTPERQMDPFIAQDESFIIYVMNSSENDTNMWISFNIGPSKWTDPVILPSPFNDKKIDGSPYVTPDKKYLFWSSNRDGETLQIYQAPFLDYYNSIFKITSPSN